MWYFRQPYSSAQRLSYNKTSSLHGRIQAMEMGFPVSQQDTRGTAFSYLCVRAYVRVCVCVNYGRLFMRTISQIALILFNHIISYWNHSGSLLGAERHYNC